MPVPRFITPHVIAPPATQPGRARRIRGLLRLLVCAGLLAAAAGAQASQPTPFSGGPLAATAPPGWTLQPAPKVERRTRYDLVRDGAKANAAIVLRAQADASAAQLRHGLFADLERTPLLRWRWRTDRVLAAADMTRKDAEDFAARICVYFDRDEDKLGFKERSLLKLARARYGDDLSAAALCYVWDNRLPAGTVRDNVYTPTVKMIVATSGGAQEGQWLPMQRDVAADYRLAFGTEPPRVVGISVGVDTDHTGERTVSYFGDLRFVAPGTR